MTHPEPSTPAAQAPPTRTRDGATPVMAQFLDMKAAHPDHLLFFRMGDFYELFFEDAVLAAEALGIALTKRGKHAGEDIAMCGVPIHNAERYLHELIRKGFRVAVAEQMEDPAEAKKRGSKSVVAREVVRLVTPGTLTEDSLLERGSHNFLAAVADNPGGGSAPGGLAWADVSTGDLFAAPCLAEERGAWLARLRPAELVARGPISSEFMDALIEAEVTPTELAGGSFDARRANGRVASVFGASSLEAYGAFGPAEIAALGALIDYVELTQRGRLPLLKPPRREAPDGAMRIDAATRRNLELTQGPDGTRAGSLLAAIDRTVSSAGARLLEARIASPLTEPSAIADRRETVRAFVERPDLRRDLRGALRRTPDLERGLGRLGLGRGGPRDLAAIRDGLRAAASCFAALAAAADVDPAWPTPLKPITTTLAGHDPLIEVMEQGLAEEPPLRLSDGGAIAEGFDPALDEARALRDQARQYVAGMQAEYAREAEITALKIKHNNVLGYFVETPATHARRMMSAPLDATFIHRQTTANAVRFTTLKLSELETKIARAADLAAELEKSAFEGLTDAALERAAEIRAAAGALAELDVAAALAELAETEGWSAPTVDASRAFRVTGGRHPVVEQALSRAKEGAFVANDCDLSADGAEADGADAARPIWLLTGPNMAGKSTFLRQNALIAVLAQTGAFVPAEAAHLGVVDQLFSRVGASDDLARGRSTFMVEMVETAAILNQAGERALVILDEIGRGTATYDGLSIAWATLEHLQGVNQCRALFATHYHELTALAASLPGLKNATISVREWKGDVVFLREVVAGAADRSYGVQVARLAGMPPAVVARSKVLLERLERGEDSAAVRAQKLVDDLPLFAAAEAAEAEAPPPALAKLAALDPDTMSPRAALDALYELKRLADET